MKKLIVLMIVLIPAAAFAAKDSSSPSMGTLCQELKSHARGHASTYLYFDTLYGEYLKDKKRVEARDAGEQSDLVLARAAQVSTVYGALCK